MIHLLLKTKTPIKFLFTEARPVPIIATTHLHFLHNSSSSSSSSSISQEEKAPINQNHSSPLTVSYLIKPCGLSPESALSASKKFNIKSTENPDAVLNVLKSYDFTDTHIVKLVSKYPKLLSFNPDTIVRPKLEFLFGIGAGAGADGTQLIEFILSCPHVLTTSVENRLKPNYDSLRPVFDTNQQLFDAVRRSSWLLTGRLGTGFLPNVRTLKGLGVPKRNIAKLAAHYPRVLMRETEQFKVIIESVKKMGFDPLSALFLKGLSAFSGLSPSSWERKVSVYKSVGWSDAEIVSAFTKHPFCMVTSEEKIRRRMELYTKEMQWGPSFVASRPKLLSFSLEKRIIPRCSVIRVLASKGLVSRQLKAGFLNMTDKEFEDRYVAKFGNRVPEILKVYKGDMETINLSAQL